MLLVELLVSVLAFLRGEIDYFNILLAVLYMAQRFEAMHSAMLPEGKEEVLRQASRYNTIHQTGCYHKSTAPAVGG